MKKIRYILFIILISSVKLWSQVDRKNPPPPLPERTVNLGKPESFTLPNGLKVIVVENHKLPTVRVDVNLDILPVKEGDKAGLSSMFGDMLRAGTTNYTKEELDEKIDFLGSDFYAGSTYLGVSALKKQLEPSMEIVSELLFQATFSNQTELDKLKKQAKTALEAGQRNPDVISGRVQKVLLYGKEDPWGEYVTEKTLDNITLSDFSQYYNTYFKPNVAYLTIVGDITPEEARQLAGKYFSGWEEGAVNQTLPALVKNSSGIKIAFVDLPSATQSSINIIGLANLKKGNKDYFPGIMGNSILGEGSSGRLFKDIREKRGWTYGAYSVLRDSYKRTGNFGAYAKVRNEVTDSAVVEILKNIKDITYNSPSEEELKQKKSEFSGNFALGLERTETIARLVRTQMIENLPADYYKNYLKNVNGVSAPQIPEALKQSIDPDNLIVLVVGRGEEILPGLKKLGYPLVHYDRYGNPEEKTSAKAEIQDTALVRVLNKYFTAVAGSRAKIEGVKAVITEAEMTLPNLQEPVSVTYKFQNPNKQVVIMSLKGQVMKQGFDGKQGYSTMRSLTEKETEEFRNRKGYFPELYYTDDTASLEGIELMDGKEVYKVKVDSDEGEKIMYFDKNTGLKLREEALLGEDRVVTDYDDYRDFSGYKFPGKVTVSSKGQHMTQIFKNYIINPSLTDSDFRP